MRGPFFVGRSIAPLLVATALFGGCNLDPVNFQDDGAGGGSGGKGDTATGSVSSSTGGSSKSSGGRTSSDGGTSSSSGGRSDNAGGASASDGGSDGTGGDPGCPAAPNGICECKKDDSQSCAKSGAKGACAAGTQECTSEGIWGPCSIKKAAADDCSVPKDDSDCDGTPNGGCPCVDGDTQPCGPPSDAGICEYGVSLCANLTYGECMNFVDARPRDCSSSTDNDCDGLPDNTVDGTCQCKVGGPSQVCDTHPGYDGVGTCHGGSQKCELGPDGTTSDWGQCTGAVGPAPKDSCTDGDNSDCVGSPNTGCTCITGRTSTCGTIYGSLGECVGVALTCGSDGKWPTDAAVCKAAAKTEDCRTPLDENCSGTVNESAACPCASAPCKNGGICNPGAGTAYNCDCSATGYEGTLCDKPRANVVTGPSGASSCVVIGISDAGTTLAAQCEFSTGSKGYLWTSSAGWRAAALASGYGSAELVGLSSDGTKLGGSMLDQYVTRWASKWSSLSATGSTIMENRWRSATSMSANGNVLMSIEGNGTIWSWTGTGTPVQYMAESGSTAVVSGNGSVVYTSWGSGGGYQKWTSPTSSSNTAIAGPLYPIAVSNDGSVMIGTFSFAADGIYKTGNNSPSNATKCKPLSLSSDGAYTLGLCTSSPSPGIGLVRWFNTTGTTVQQLLTALGSSYSVPTNQDAKMAYNASWVAVPTGNNGDIAILHIGPN
jgi:hypothetical protein